MNKVLSIASALLFSLSLYVNFLAGTGGLNGISTGEISGMYPTLFTPAGITFSIWGVIFLFNTVFVLSQIYLAFVKPTSFNKELNIIYLGLSTVNMSWLLLWHHLHISFALLVIVLYLMSTLRSYMITNKLKSQKGFVHQFANINFSIYAGWLSVATIANAAVCLTSVGVNPYGTLPVVLTAVVIVVALLFSFFFLTNQQNFWYPLVVCWALLGIFMANSSSINDGSSSVKLIALVALILLIVIAAYFALRKVLVKN